jgi:hypothetical protein
MRIFRSIKLFKIKNCHQIYYRQMLRKYVFRNPIIVDDLPQGALTRHNRDVCAVSLAISGNVSKV